MNELQEWLMSLDEITVLELLELTSEDLVNAFEDRIEEKAEELEKEFNER